MDTKNPHTAEPVTAFATQAEWEQERERRELRAALEWHVFHVWWEALKIELSACAFKGANGERRTPEEIDRLYRERRIKVHDAIEKIWSGFPDIGQA
jgi:hypothetical protein